ncbi:methylated-DNA--[protein]-cysteine S-methyltransferase [Anatilimnocola floriformis]|uniref:methylated-DNA--[protein]-cysteine S-methyltransferase n=1 Tax=Anatilimnocola floriformis TaxID=2948575 RepID=UPI0020C3834B|nr:methylated-DNA--[protein]-cysteine S-methyltransferase [Anatilimnocola floriformis]
MPQLKSLRRQKSARRKSTPHKAVVSEYQCAVFDSEVGWIVVEWQGDKITLISFGHDSPAAAAQRSQAEPVDGSETPTWVARFIAKLKKFAVGKVVDWSDAPLDFGAQSAFQKKVQRAVLRIPRGEIRSYGEIAAAAGSPGAARAVGSVMRMNRFPLVIPCHRVVASGGKVGGYSCPSGIEMKEKLLALEGVTLK